jgi:HEAT repeat protein
MRVIRILIAVLIGILLVAGVIWLLTRTLRPHETLYAGKPLDAWARQLNSHDAGVSNQAFEVLNAEIIPRLVDQMYHDTNDSQLRKVLTENLGRLPGVHLSYVTAQSRRMTAAHELGVFGPPAKAAVPFLIQALNGPQTELHETAIRSLGAIHSNPDVVIPLLMPYLTNDDWSEEATVALGNYGSLATDAFPKIVPLLHAGDLHVRMAARVALKQIDPDAAAKAGAGPPRKNGP